MAVLNVLMVALTIGTKALRGVRGRRTKASTDALESALDNSLITGEIHPDLLDLNDREKDLLAILMVEYLSVLSGAERDRLVGIAEESGLVRSYFDRLARATGGARRGPREPRVLRRPRGRVPPDAAPRPPGRDRQGRRRKGPGPHRDQGGGRVPRRDPERPLRAHPLRMAENLERIGTLAVDPLIETLEGDAAGQASVLAARILGYLRASEARQALKRAMLEGELTDLRAQATLALGKIGNLEDVPALQEAAGDEEWPVRAQAANALEMIGDVSTIRPCKSSPSTWSGGCASTPPARWRT
jgi:hypothetical protein